MECIILPLSVQVSFDLCIMVSILLLVIYNIANPVVFNLISCTFLGIPLDIIQMESCLSPEQLNKIRKTVAL